MNDFKCIEHLSDALKIVEIQSDEIIIQNEGDALDLMANMDYQYESRKIIVHKNNVNPDFFDLRTGIAGQILQKFSNYRVQLAIVGDFSEFQSKSLRDFIFESNKTRHVMFLPDVATAIRELS